MVVGLVKSASSFLLHEKRLNRAIMHNASGNNRFLMFRIISLFWCTVFNPYLKFGFFLIQFYGYFFTNEISYN